MGTSPSGFFSGSLQLGTGLMGEVKLFGIGVSFGGKRYYEFSTVAEPTENLNLVLNVSITEDIGAGFDFTGTIDASTKVHLENSGYAGIKIGEYILGWNDIPDNGDIIIPVINLDGYVGVGGGITVEMNLSELKRRMSN